MSVAAVFPSLLPMFVVVAIRRAEQRIHRQLADAGAVTADSAIQLSLGRAFDGSRLEALVRSGAVRVAADQRHYLDAEGWNRHQLARRRRVLLVLSVILPLVCFALALAYASR